MSRQKTDAKAEKTTNGEVFTPRDLVCDVLDQIPDWVWSDKTLKWLDACAGLGNFSVEIYARLMNGLSGSIPDVAERKQHILTKMLWAVELNEKNYKVCRFVLDPSPDRIANVLNQDFLTWDPGFKFGVVVSNPPYATGRKRGDTTIHSAPFVKRSIGLLNPNGYYAFVIPSGKIRKCIASGQMAVSIKLNVEFPGIRLNVDHGVIKNGLVEITQFQDKHGCWTGDWNDETMCPYSNPIWRSLWSAGLGSETKRMAVSGQAVDLKLTGSFKAVQGDTFKVVETTNSLPMLSIRKVACSRRSWNIEPRVVEPGLGIGGGLYGFIFNEPDLSLFKSRFHRAIRLLESRGGTTVSKFVFEKFKPIPCPMSDDQIYAFFGLTSDEVSEVERLVSKEWWWTFMRNNRQMH